MNPLLTPINGVLSLPQMFNGKLWMLRAINGDGEKLLFSVSDIGNQHDEHPFSTAFVPVSRSIIRALCRSQDRHERATLTGKDGTSELIFIANHRDNICAREDVLVLFRSNTHEDVSLTMNKRWFA